MINLVPLVTAQAVAFWVLAPIAVLGALGMVLAASRCTRPCLWR